MWNRFKAKVGKLKANFVSIVPDLFTRANFKFAFKGISLMALGMGSEMASAYVFSELVVTMTSGAATTMILGIEFTPMGLLATGGAITWGGKLTTNYSRTIMAPIGARSTQGFLLRYLDQTIHESTASRQKTEDGERNRFLNQSFVMGQIASQFYEQIVPTSLRIVMGGAFLSKVCPKEVGLGLGALIIGFFMYGFGTQYIVVKSREKIQEEGEKSYKDVSRGLMHAQTIQNCNKELAESKKVENTLQGFIDAMIQSAKVTNGVNAGQDTLTTFGTTALGVLAYQAILNSKMSVNQFFLVVTYLPQFIIPMSDFGNVMRAFLQLLIDMDGVLSFLAKSTCIPDLHPNNELKLNPAGFQIRFDNVSFVVDEEENSSDKKKDNDENDDQKIESNENEKSTEKKESKPKKKTILENISFTIEPGQKVAFVGGSGAGKSTIGRLLFRTYDVTSGAIYIDGKNIQEVGLHHLRSAIGIIPQKPVIFDLTIRQNIAFGSLSENVSDAEIKAASEMAQLGFVTKRQKGLDGPANNLSGGEEQRIAIARTIMKNPHILLCDEPTTGLDTENERLVQNALDAYTRAKSMPQIVIAHRLSTVVNADKIIVLREGKKVDEGTHTELLHRCDYYNKLWREYINNPGSLTNEQKIGHQGDPVPAIEYTGAGPGPSLIQYEHSRLFPVANKVAIADTTEPAVVRFHHDPSAGAGPAATVNIDIQTDATTDQEVLKAENLKKQIRIF